MTEPHATGAQLAPALDIPRVASTMAAWRKAQGRDAPVRVAVERVHFSAKRPTVVQYRVETAGEAALVVLGEIIGARASDHAADEYARLAKRFGRALGDAPALWHAPDLGLVLRPSGLDAKLPGLGLLLTTGEAEERVAAALGVSARGWRSHVRLRAHRLGKRAVLEIALEGETERHRVFARLRPTAKNAGARAFEHHCEIAARLGASNDVAAPAPIGFDEEIGAAFYAALPGRPLTLSDAAPDIAAAMRALGAFHRLAPREGAHHRTEDEVALTAAAIGRLEPLRPDLHDLGHRALDRAAEALLALPEVAPGPAHRDFHEGQVLVDDGPAGLLDFDTFRQADPALDIGNFIAHIRLASLRAGRSLEGLERAAMTGSDPACVGPWTRIALVRLGAIYGFSTDDARHAPALFEQALG